MAEQLQGVTQPNPTDYVPKNSSARVVSQEFALKILTDSELSLSGVAGLGIELRLSVIEVRLSVIEKAGIAEISLSGIAESVWDRCLGSLGSMIADR